MKRSLAAIGTILICTAIVVAVLAAVSFIVPERVGWLRVWAPERVPKGGYFELRVNLSRAVPGTWLSADIHAHNAARAYLGYVSGAKPIRMTAGRLDYSFTIPVPDRADLAYADGLVYLSREGTWGSLIDGASLAAVPIVGPSGTASSGGGHLSRSKLSPLFERSVPHRERAEALPLRLLAALAFAACALLSVLSPRKAVPLAAACLAACAWELAMPEELFSAFLRGLSGAEGWYAERRGPQVVLASVVFVAVVAGASTVLVRAVKGKLSSAVLAWLALCLYACLAVLQIESEHDLDALFASPFAGIQIGQAARLFFALLCLAALALDALSRRIGAAKMRRRSY
jgi:hypothetical protein